MPVVILTLGALSLFAMQLAMGRHPAYAGIVPLTVAFAVRVLFSM